MSGEASAGAPLILAKTEATAAPLRPVYLSIRCDNLIPQDSVRALKGGVFEPELTR